MENAPVKAPTKTPNIHKMSKTIRFSAKTKPSIKLLLIKKEKIRENVIPIKIPLSTPTIPTRINSRKKTDTIVDFLAPRALRIPI